MLEGSAKREKGAKVLRVMRKLHRTTGIILFAFFFVMATTGLLLGWKKHSGGLLLAPTEQGLSADPAGWLPIQELHKAALNGAQEHLPDGTSSKIDRIDVRPDKGIAKFIFKEGYWSVQLDLTTGKLLSVERRRSDFIENLHDGLLWDNLAGTRGEEIKLIYTTIMGSALLLFTISGFWLWYGPRRLRRNR